MRLWLLTMALLLASQSDAGHLSRIIDEHLERAHESARVVPAPLVDDAAFLRRISLDLIGRIPTPGEVITFLDDADPEKRETMIDRLLESPEHAAHFARTWRGLLLPESDTDRQIRYFVPGFEAWLQERRRQRAGFDAIVRELLTVPITGTPERPQLVLRDLKAPNPVAFIAAKNAGAAEIAAATTRLFLGVRLECAQCHDHPFDHWTQHQFWNQAAFFAGIERRGRGAFAPILEVPDRRSIPLMDSDVSVPALFLDEREPTLRDGSSSRVALAEWITAAENPFFAKAIANRVWAELMGIGIVDPVDDMHALNPPSHPELLDDLARAFQDSRFDVGLLYRAICRSDAYQRTSRRTDPSQEQESLFARKVLKPMTGEQFFDSFAQVIGYERQRSRTGGDEDATRRRVIELFATHGAERDPETSVVQALTLMNGRLVDRAVSPESSPTLTSLLDEDQLTDAARIEYLYLLTFSRRPNAGEQGELQSFVSAGGAAERGGRLGDVFWMLLNSAEFRWNH